MKLFCSLLFLLLAATTMAQRSDAELGKVFDKNKLLLKKTKLSMEAPRLGIIIPETSIVHSLPQDNMPCIIPRINVLVAIPNALPQLNIPDVAAIPNLAFHKDFQKGAVISGPDPE